jgi:3-phosphoshikimate 1-carboxyvinyltransferase
VRVTVQPARRLRGTIQVPGDKSISHRAAIFNAIAEGQARVTGFLQGQDCLSTVSCLRALGVPLELDQSNGSLLVQGVGLHGLREPADVLDAGNSGTTMRLLSGLLAGQPFFSILTGDASLRRRPMERVLEPLRSMGAGAWSRDGGLAPLAIRGGNLKGLHYRLPVASAQVKSSLILAGLYADGESVLEEPAPSRDHTERMLSAMGARIETRGLNHSLQPPERLVATDVSIPGDLSAAAFWIVAATVHPDAEIVLPGIGVNQTRTGLLDALQAMGGNFELTNQRFNGGEPIADLTVRSSRLHGAVIDGDTTLRLEDEVPALAVAAALAEGQTVIRDAAELRVKESDRIASVVRMLQAFGVDVEEYPDGMVIQGQERLDGALLDSEGDHRLAMAYAVAGLVAGGETVIEGAEAVSVSYPGFWQDLQGLSDASLVGR